METCACVGLKALLSWSLSFWIMNTNRKFLTVVQWSGQKNLVGRYEVRRSLASLAKRESEALSREVSHHHEDQIVVGRLDRHAVLRGGASAEVEEAADNGE